MDWDKDSESVAVVQEDSRTVFIWNVNLNRTEEMEVDSSKARASFAKWSKTHPMLAIGTDKVNLNLISMYLINKIDIIKFNK